MQLSYIFEIFLLTHIVNGEEVSFEEKGITSTFRLATEEDIANAEKDEIEYNKELDDFINSPHDTSLEDMFLNHLGLDDKKIVHIHQPPLTKISGGIFILVPLTVL